MKIHKSRTIFESSERQISSQVLFKIEFKTIHATHLLIIDHTLNTIQMYAKVIHPCRKFFIN